MVLRALLAFVVLVGVAGCPHPPPTTIPPEVPKSQAPTLEPSAYFTVVAPSAIQRGEPFILEAFVHTKGQRSSIVQATSHSEPRVTSVGPRRIPTGTVIDVRFDVPGIEIKSPTATLEWTGELGIVSVVGRVPDTDAATFAGTASFRVAGVVIAEAAFLLTVGPLRSERVQVTTNSKAIRSVFVSYSTKDRERVKARIQGLRAVAPYVDVFIDYRSLTQGDLWEQKIEQAIESCDLFLLFWSTAASESKYVEQEWRHALKMKGLTGIRPVPLESPDTIRPPPELESLHFYDWTVTDQ